jgi:hypothetical protein
MLAHLLKDTGADVNCEDCHPGTGDQLHRLCAC